MLKIRYAKEFARRAEKAGHPPVTLREWKEPLPDGSMKRIREYVFQAPGGPFLFYETLEGYAESNLAPQLKNVRFIEMP